MRAAAAAVRQKALPVICPASTGRLLLAAAFFFGYLSGIPAGRAGGGIAGSLAKHYMEPSSYAAFIPVWEWQFAAAFLQITLVFLCGFHLWGNIFLGVYFAGRGILLGACASGVYAAEGVHGLTVYWLLTVLPNLGLLFAALWLAGDACRMSGALVKLAFSGSRRTLPADIRRMCSRYAFCIVICAAGSVPCAALTVFLAGVLL